MPLAAAPPNRDLGSLDAGARRWLHDKYERLAAEEGQLAANRTSYFATIGTVLITGLLLSLNYFLATPRMLLVVVSFLASLGILISLVWVVLLHRTIDAQHLWREGAMHLERLSPPVDGALTVPITLRSGAELEIDLGQPYTAHARRFSNNKAISWMDRVSPDALSQVLPLSFVIIWVLILSACWALFGAQL